MCNGRSFVELFADLQGGAAAASLKNYGGTLPWASIHLSAWPPTQRPREGIASAVYCCAVYTHNGTSVIRELEQAAVK